MSRTPLVELVGMSRSLGHPERSRGARRGNTSVRLDGESFLVKASGTSLESAGTQDFVRMDLLRRTLAFLELDDRTRRS